MREYRATLLKTFILSTLPCINKLGIIPVPHCHEGSFSIVEVDNFSQPEHHVLPLSCWVTVHLFLAFGLQLKMSPRGITPSPLLCKFTWSHFQPSPPMVESSRFKGKPLNRKTPPLLLFLQSPQCLHWLVRRQITFSPF